MKKILITGGRFYSETERVFDVLDSLRAMHGRITIAHGDCTGADSIADVWAKRRGVPCKQYPAEWTKYRDAAGILRNGIMLFDFLPDMCVAFPGNAGTADMVARCKAAGVPVMQVI